MTFLQGQYYFLINLTDMFYECDDSDIERYTDDTMPYS